SFLLDEINCLTQICVYLSEELEKEKRTYLSGDKLVKTAGNKYKCPICSNNFNSHTEVVNHVKEIHQTMLLGAIYRQDSKHARHLLFKEDKKKVCRELDRLINELMRAEEKYLPLIEHGYPVKYVFTQSHQISAEKEKVETTIENLYKEAQKIHESLLKNYTTLKDDALLENNSDYYLERLLFIRARKLYIGWLIG
ncbi:15992_t:CDS:2, partial [Gigaspora margarita]